MRSSKLATAIHCRGFLRSIGPGFFMIREIPAINGMIIRGTGIFAKRARSGMLVQEGKFRFRTDEQPEMRNGS
ncbi:hypothetical protein [Methanoregula sp.]|uniref:hypothetical protein n=1 Tax=Methanoregula sp. TaxID=2052170 RepID=UPI0025EEAA49|nr:hypothetical protein [Methanoregula sp.]